MDGLIHIVLGVEGDVRAAYNAVREALATDTLPDGPLDGRPFVVRLLELAIAKSTQQVDHEADHQDHPDEPSADNRPSQEKSTATEKKKQDK